MLSDSDTDLQDVNVKRTSNKDTSYRYVYGTIHTITLISTSRLLSSFTNTSQYRDYKCMENI